MRGRLMRRFILWLAWKIDHACHSVIEKLDPIPDEAIREVMKELRVACERAKVKAKMRAERKDSANRGHGRRRWLVSIYEERRIQIEVEADNGAEARHTAVAAYLTCDDLRDDMLKEEALFTNRVCVEKDIGPANGIVAEKEKCER